MNSWKKIIQLVEEDQITVNFPPGFTAHNNDFI